MSEQDGQNKSEGKDQTCHTKTMPGIPFPVRPLVIGRDYMRRYSAQAIVDRYQENDSEHDDNHPQNACREQKRRASVAAPGYRFEDQEQKISGVSCRHEGAESAGESLHRGGL